jgi:zinc protease
LRPLLIFSTLLMACAPKIPAGPIPFEQAKQPVRWVEVPDQNHPNVYFQALIAAGSARDPLGSEGVAHLTAQALAEAGAGDRTSQDLRDALYPTGNGLEVRVDREWVSVRLRCHRDHQALCATVFADVLTAPRFDPTDIARLRDNALYRVSEGLLGDEEALGQETLDAVVYEGHPYGHPVAGRAGVLGLLEDTDVRTFYDKTYVRESVWVGLAGAFDPATRELLATQLEDLPGVPAPELVLQSPTRVHGRSLQIVSTQTQVTGFHFAHPIAVTRRDPDWNALTVAMTALGAHRQSFGRLFRTLRTDRGLNYGDYAYVEAYSERRGSSLPEQGVLRQQPYFYVWIRPTSIENGPFALKLAVLEIERLVADGLDSREFEDVRAYLKGSLPLLAQDPGRRLAYALDAAATETPNPLVALTAALDALTVEEVNAAVRRHVHPDTLRIIAVTGEAETLKRRLLEEASTPIVYNDVQPSEAQIQRDTEAADWPIGLTEDTIWIAPAQGLFQ